MQKLLSLLLFLSCSQTPTDQKTASLPSTAPSTSTPLNLPNTISTDTPAPVFDNVYDFLRSGQFPVDSASVSHFAGSWYAFTNPITFKGFQPFGVAFPFEYLLEDSTGHQETLYFNSIPAMAQWRTTQSPEMNAWGLAHFDSPEKLVWEGYAHLMLGPERHVDLPQKMDSDQIILNYLFPKTKVEYHFRKKEGLWQVFKRVQKVYSQKDLDRLSKQTFEGFAMRFITETPFRMGRVKWPLKTTDISVEDGSKSSYFTKKETSHLSHAWEEPLIMYTRQGTQSPLQESTTMYFCSKDEGGVSFGYVFTKIRQNWTLMEYWDGSN